MRQSRQDIHANDGETAPRGVLARLSYAKVFATLALFVALGGAATAATLARDSSGAPQIETEAVRSPEIKTNAVRSPEIQDGSVHLADIAPDTRTALEARVRVATAENEAVPTCTLALTDCPNPILLINTRCDPTRATPTPCAPSACSATRSAHLRGLRPPASRRRVSDDRDGRRPGVR